MEKSDRIINKKAHDAAYKEYQTDSGSRLAKYASQGLKIASFTISS